jgi:hypothetical protein
MPESELAALTRLIDDLNESTGDLATHSAEQTRVQVELRQELGAIKAKLPEFVPKRRFRWVIAAVVLVLVAALAIGLLFRIRDADEEHKRRAFLVSAQEQDRQSSIRGCERNNDLRATLREVIEDAYAPSPVPSGLSPELRDLIIQSQERAAVKRDEQLSKPGIQPVNCQAQFPPLAAIQERT